MAGDLALLILGLAILIGAGDVLVRGAVGLSLRLRMPALVVSLVVVAAGTTAPELVISVRSVADGLPGLALGNVVGSNIANALLVIGLPALIAGFAEPDRESRRSYLRLLGALALFSAFMLSGRVPPWGSAVLLLALALVLFDTVRHALALRTGPETEPAADLPGGNGKASVPVLAAFLFAGFAGLALGADLLVGAAERIAGAMGIAPAVIGLTVVAIGTSLPELATAVTAGLKGRGDVVLGSVIGANIYNLLGITGVAALAGDMTVPARFAGPELWALWAATATLVPLALFGRPLGRPAGLALTAGYIVYVVTRGG